MRVLPVSTMRTSEPKLVSQDAGMVEYRLLDCSFSCCRSVSSE